jgi:hypothetical protein
MAFEVCVEIAETVQASKTAPGDLDWQYYLDNNLRSAFASFQLPDLDNPNFKKLLNSLEVILGT